VTERKIQGSVQSIDSFGNLVTSIPADALASVPRGEETAVVCDEHETRGIFNAYEDQPPMTLIAVVGNSGQLELAIVGDSAAIMLGVTVGTPVSVSW
jgi:S-adenosyl-L-methionine hydrolase (adenosine-forming)